MSDKCPNCEKGESCKNCDTSRCPDCGSNLQTTRASNGRMRKTCKKCNYGYIN